MMDNNDRLEEQQGLLHFTTINNDGSDENLLKLVDLKNIIAKQLPNMPKIYITRLVLDRTHYSLIGIKNGRLIGGITFKPCNKPNVPKFIEVVFLCNNV
jgi:histone acetyltransferase